MPMSVRLDPKTEQAVKRLARRRRQTRSAVVREAIAALERDEAARASEPPTPWESLRHLVGVVDSGGDRLSEDTGGKLRALLQAKTDARRTR
jgi:Arc/MetJ-type ribon-helix-helix transcriptional regulator